MHRSTALLIGKWALIAIIIWIPIQFGYNLYKQSELGMIRYARELYNKPSSSISGYIKYYNKYPHGDYANESRNALIEHYSSVEIFFHENVRSYSWEKVDTALQRDIAKAIMEKTNSQADSLDFDIYYIQNKDKAFYEDTSVSNIGKRRNYKIIDRK